jgi:hypothetical protein
MLGPSMASVMRPRAFALSRGFTLEDVKKPLGHSSSGLTSNTDGAVLEQRQLEVAQRMDAALGGCCTSSDKERRPGN